MSVVVSAAAGSTPPGLGDVDGADADADADADAEVIVVLEDPDDDGRWRAWSPGAAVRVLYGTDRTPGAVGGFALGAQLARGRVLFLTDGSVDLAAGTAARLMAAVEDNDIAAAGPAIAGRDGDPQPVAGMTVDRASFTPRWARHSGLGVGPVAAVSAAAMAVRRDCFDSVGGFDLSGGSSALADLELSIRLWRAGFTVVVDPDAMVTRRSIGDLTDPLVTGHGLDDLLRIAGTHLDSTDLERVLMYWQQHDPARALPALARMLAGDDIAPRREWIELDSPLSARRWLDRFAVGPDDDPEPAEAAVDATAPGSVVRSWR